LSSFWFLLTKRGLDVCQKYIQSIQEFEEHFLPDSAKSISRVISMAQSKKKSLERNHGKTGFFSSLFSVRRVSFLIIIVFMIFYLITLIEKIF
jgi:hypothetical protein